MEYDVDRNHDRDEYRWIELKIYISFSLYKKYHYFIEEFINSVKIHLLEYSIAWKQHYDKK